MVMASSTFIFFLVTLFFPYNTNDALKLKLISTKSVDIVSNQTAQEEFKSMMDSTRNRFASILYGPTSSTIRPTLTTTSRISSYFVNFSVGQPPVQQLALLDTGSTLIWLDSTLCRNCCPNCPPEIKKYDPTRSSTYTQLDCHDAVCDGTVGCWCNKDTNECSFQQDYASGLRVRGLVGREKLTFVSPDGSHEDYVPNAVVGVAQSKKFGSYSSDRKYRGIFGLGVDGDISFINNLGCSFSYCLGDPTDVTYEHSTLFICQGARLEGSSTPFKRYNGHYHVTLEGISFNGELLNIDAKVFERNSDTRRGGVIMDSGTSFTVLTRPAYDVVRANIHAFVTGQYLLRRYYLDDEADTLCYDVDDKEYYIRYFPAFTFHFKNNATMVVDGINMFYNMGYPPVICLGIVPHDSLPDNGGDDDSSDWEYEEDEIKHMSILGLNSQMYVSIGVDPSAQNIYFDTRSTGCHGL